MLRRDIGEIRRAARYLLELMDDTMDLARIDAVRMPVHREMADLTQVIAEAVDIAGRLLTGKPVGLSVMAAGDIPLLMLDRTRIRQVLLNLLTNAIRFTERGSIAVTARVEGEQVIVSVADTGLGIAGKDLRRIFDEFEQVDVNRPPEASGKGLGLAIAKHLIHLHGGGIWAESEPGKGSVFRFSLPVTPKQVGYVRRPSSQPALAAQQPRILVADEEGEAAAFLARHLDGFTVTAASPIQEAAAPLTGPGPDLAVVVTPPNGSPQATIDALRLPESVPVVSCRFPTRRRLARDPRFCAHLLKPASAEELMGTVMRLAPSGTVLAADDEPGFLQLLRRTFHAAGQEHRLLTVSSGPEALETARRVRPALVLLDIVLPGMSGPEVASAMKGDPDLSSIPLIALSGADVGGDPTALSIREFALQVGACLTGEQFLRLVRYTVAALNPLSPIGEDTATATSPAAAPRPAS